MALGRNHSHRIADTHRKIFFLVSFVCLTLVVRSVDPMGWRDWLPLTVVWLARDTGTAALYSLMYGTAAKPLADPTPS